MMYTSNELLFSNRNYINFWEDKIMSVGNRVYLKKPMAAQELLDGFEHTPCANVADTMGRLASMHPRIQLLSKPEKAITAGRAVTIKCRAGDNLMLHKALNMIEPGDVLIVSNDGGEGYRSLTGEIMFTYAMAKGAAGMIIDGPIRDVDMVRECKMPIYATGANPGGPYKDGNGEINTPISCGGISVNPGDVVVMDTDGVVIVPLRDAEEILEAAIAYHEQDAAKLVDAANGISKRDWVEKSLEKIGTEIIDDCYM